MVIENLANLQILNTCVFSATNKQKISWDHITNRHSSKIYLVGVEQQNFQVQKELYTIHLNQQNWQEIHYDKILEQNCKQLPNL